MVGKNKIGRIQLIIGIIILVIGILGLIWSTSKFVDFNRDLVKITPSEENMYFGIIEFSFTLFLMSISIILIILSLIFITQGLLNKLGNQNV